MKMLITLILLCLLTMGAFAQQQPQLPERQAAIDSIKGSRALEHFLLTQNLSTEAREWARQARNSRITSNVCYTAAGAFFVGGLIGMGTANTQEDLARSLVLGIGGMAVLSTVGMVFDIGAESYKRKAINAYVSIPTSASHTSGITIRIYF